MSASDNRVCASPIPDTSPERIPMNGHTKGAVLRSHQWPNHQAIRVRFLGGDPLLQARVKAVATEWTDISGLTFKFIAEGPADIRVAFVQDNRSWSYIGTDCTRIAEPQATMNFGWLTADSPDDVLRPVVLHEFGHAIGMIHEHQNPHGGIQWNMDAVVHDLSGPPNNWDSATIQNNMFRAYAPGEVDATKLDTASIMMYPLPAAWTTDGTSAGFNNALSATDRQFIASVYPR